MTTKTEESPTHGVALLPSHLQSKAAALGILITKESLNMKLSFSEATLCVLAVGNDMVFFDRQETKKEEDAC